ncbi:MAG: hypothetical protein ABI783_07910 [Actinomycetota bacterium]
MIKAERLGPLAGLISLALLLVNLLATRSAPEPETPTARMVAEILAHRNTYVTSAALILGRAFFLLVFAAALGAILGRMESETAWLGGLAALGGSRRRLLPLDDRDERRSASPSGRDVGAGGVLGERVA